MSTFTVKMLDGLKPRKSGPYRVADTVAQGLNFQVSKNAKTWTLRYRDNRDRRRFIKIGSWPALGIAAARDRARIKIAEIEGGADPKARPEATSATVDEILDFYMAAKKDTAKSYISMLTYRRKVPGWFEDKLASKVTMDDCHAVLRPIAKKTPTMANRVLTFLRTAFNHAIDIEYDLTRDRDVSFGVKSNPFKEIKKIAAAEKPASVRLTMENIAAAWVHIGEYNSAVTSLAIRFHIAMYGRRVKDTLFARWEEIIEVDGIKCLALPEGRTKSGKPQTIPLSPLAIEVLEEVQMYTGHCECIFPQRSTISIPMTLTGLSQATRRIRKTYPTMGEFAPRYCRAAVVTELGNLGVDRHLLDLAHQRHIRSVSSVGTKAYDRAHRINQINTVALAWDDLLRHEISDFLRCNSLDGLNGS